MRVPAVAIKLMKSYQLLKKVSCPWLVVPRHLPTCRGTIPGSQTHQSARTAGCQCHELGPLFRPVIRELNVLNSRPAARASRPPPSERTSPHARTSSECVRRLRTAGILGEREEPVFFAESAEGARVETAGAVACRLLVILRPLIDDPPAL